MYTEEWKDFISHYQSPQGEQDARHIKSTLLCDLSGLGLVQISGLDAKKFLQGQLTCDMAAITPEHSAMGAHCNAQGRIISLFYLFEFEKSYYLLLPRSMVDIAIAALKKYAVFYKAELSDASDKLIIIGCAGIPKDGTSNAAVIQPSAATNRFMLAGSIETIKAIWDQHAQNASIAGMHEWKHLNITDGIPAVYPETSEKFLPHELNLDKLNAISFEKGCYTGQEIIARMHYRGKLKHHMYLTSIAGRTVPLPGDDVCSLQGQDIRASGLVVDSSSEGHDKYLALLTTDESSVKNEHLFLDHDYKAFFTFLQNENNK